MNERRDDNTRLGTKVRPWLWVMVPGALLASLLLAAVAGAGPGPAAWAAARFGHGHGHAHGWGSGEDGATHENAAQHARFATDWALRGVGATDAQREQLGEALESAIGDLMALAPEHRANRDALVVLLGQDQVEPEALEQLRADELALADRASQRIADVLLEATTVLDGEQRRELLEAMETLREHRGSRGLHRRWGHGD